MEMFLDYLWREGKVGYLFILGDDKSNQLSPLTFNGIVSWTYRVWFLKRLTLDSELKTNDFGKHDLKKFISSFKPAHFFVIDTINLSISWTYIDSNALKLTKILTFNKLVLP